MADRKRGEGPPVRCPACDHLSLPRVPLEAGLVAYGCSACEGHWLATEEYRAWLARRHDGGAPERSSEKRLTIADVQHARLCPVCQRIMLRYRVGHGVDFSIDLCGCGIWFDRNEWLTLKDRGLHDDLHLIATEPWQADVRREETRQHLESLYKRRYGPEYEDIVRLRRWLGDHPQRASILAFLDDPDPFSV
jgi:Zn-finger nucleic acid-binding protein